MWRNLLAVWISLSAACGGEDVAMRRTTPQTAGVPAPAPAMSGTRADAPLDLPKPMQGDTLVPLPAPTDDDADGGTLPLPRSAAAKPPADPSITFDWQESTPLAEACEPGQYTGTFSCVFTLHDEFAQLLGLMTQLTGPVTITLARSMNGEFLEITDGRFDAVAEAIIGASASIRGKLDCRTQRFEAMLVDGMWAVGDPAFPLLPGGVLTGTMSGMYENESIAGEWKLGDPTLGDCAGSWNVRLTP